MPQKFNILTFSANLLCLSLKCSKLAFPSELAYVLSPFDLLASDNVAEVSAEVSYKESLNLIPNPNSNPRLSPITLLAVLP